MKQLKKKLLNYDFTIQRNQEDKVNDCLEAMKISKEKRQTTELQIIEIALKNFPFISKLFVKGYFKQLKECYKVITPLHLKKGQCVFYQGDIAEQFYILIRGKVSIMTLKDQNTLEKERKELSIEHQQDIEASVNQLQFLQDVKRKQELSKQSLNDRREGINAPLQILETNNQNSAIENNNSQKQRERSFEFSPIKYSTENSPIKFQDSNYLQVGIKSNFANTLSQEKKIKIDQDSTAQNDSVPQNKVVSFEQSALDPLNYPIRQKIHSYFSPFEQEQSSSLQIQSEQSAFYKQIGKLMVPELPGNLLIEEIYQPKKLFHNGIYQYSTVNNIKVGESFGEGGLILRRPRTATVICSEDTSFAVISSSDYNLIFKDIQNRKMMKKINLIAKYMDPIIPFQATCRLSLAFQKISLFLNQILFSQGDPLAYVYFIKRGEVEISVQSKDIIKINENETISLNKIQTKEKAKHTILSLISSGSFFGEEDIIDNQPQRSFTARVKSSEAIIFRIKEQEFRFIIASSSSISEFFQKRMRIKQKWRTNQQILVENKQFQTNDMQPQAGQKKKDNYVLNQIGDFNQIMFLCKRQSIKLKELPPKSDDIFLTQQLNLCSPLKINPDELEKLKNIRKTEKISSKRPQSAGDILTTLNFFETANEINQQLVSCFDSISKMSFSESLKIGDKKENRISSAPANTQKQRIQSKYRYKTSISPRKTEIKINTSEREQKKDNSISYLRNKSFQNRYLKESGSFIIQSNKITNETLKNTRHSTEEIQNLLNKLTSDKNQEPFEFLQTFKISNFKGTYLKNKNIDFKQKQSQYHSSASGPSTVRELQHLNKVTQNQLNNIRLREKAVTQRQLRRPIYPFRNPQNCTLKKTFSQIDFIPLETSNLSHVHSLVPLLKPIKFSMSMPGTTSNTPRAQCKNKNDKQNNLNNKNDEYDNNNNQNQNPQFLQRISFVSQDILINPKISDYQKLDSSINQLSHSYFVNKRNSQSASKTSIGSIEEFLKENSIASDKESQLITKNILNESKFKICLQKSQSNSIFNSNSEPEKTIKIKMVKSNPIQRISCTRSKFKSSNFQKKYIDEKKYLNSKKFINQQTSSSL